jgi:glutamate carboxypeptidase
MPLSDVEAALCRQIEGRRAALLDDLRLHVGIPTGANHKAGLDETRERLASRLRSLGASVELIPGTPRPDWLYGVTPGGHLPPTAVCRRDGHPRAHERNGTTNGAPPVSREGSGSDDKPRVLIAGHLDTVHDPAGTFRSLSIAPDGKTGVGPGCVDMKGGLVIAVAAIEAIEEAGITVPWTVLLNSDEETGSYCSEAALRAEAARNDLGLALEPAMPKGELAVERGGSGQFMIEVGGRSAHVGRDFDSGISAVTKLAECIGRVGALPDPGRGIVANIGPIEGGTATNVVPDRARAWGNVRFGGQASAEALEAAVVSMATTEDALPRVTVRTSFNRPAKPLTPAVESLALEARRAAEDLGQRLPFGKTGGVCDGNILQDAGLPTIDTLGVRGGGLHTPQEWIEIASLVERCQLLAVLILRLGGAK